MALALAAVFGSMSLANPVQAQTTPTVSDVAVTVTGAEAADSVATAVIGGNTGETAYNAGRNLGFNVVFTVAAGNSFGSGDSITIEMPGFGTPGSDTVNTDVRISNGATVTPALSTILLGGTDAVQWGDGEVTIDVPDFTNYVNGGTTPRYMEAADTITVFFSKGAGITTPAAQKTTVENDTGIVVQWSVEGVMGDAAADGVPVVAQYEAPPEIPVADHTMIVVDPSGSEPGENAEYTLTFVSGRTIPTGTGKITVKMEDYGFPDGPIDEGKITMRITAGPSLSATACLVDSGEVVDGVTAGNRVPLVAGNCPTDSTAGSDLPVADQAANPEAVTISGSEISLTVPDFGDAGDGDQGIHRGDSLHIVFRQSAGITNPTEGGRVSPGKAYPWEVDGRESDTSVTVPIVISLDENDGVRGDTIMVTGKGFKNGHTASFWLDRNMNNMRDTATEAVLCSAQVMDDDTASCTFDISNPPFTGGVGGVMQMTTDASGDLKCDINSDVLDCNFVNGADGIGNVPTTITGVGDQVIARDMGMVDDQTFELKAAVSISPSGGSVGDSIQIQMTDFPANASVNSVTIAGVMVTGVSASADPRGNRSFSITIPNNVPQGVERLEVKAGDPEVTANTKITIAWTWHPGYSGNRNC